MRRILYIFIILFFNLSISYAQENLVMENAEFVNARDTIKLGDTLTVKFEIRNNGDVKYSGVIVANMRTSLEAAPLTRQETRTIEPGKSTSIQVKFKTVKPYFQQGKKSIIVIWPTGTGTVIRGDTLRKTVTTIGILSVNDTRNNLSHVRFYPNPTQNIIYYEIQKPELQIKKISVSDLQGRVIQTEPKHFSALLYMDLSAYKTGMYFINIEFNDNSNATYRIIKTE
ncbi:MAG: T9SS type A sorting domain-containing protein [Sphingobacteriales bacterium]|nr:MAG: T9SS type A sorting domain-containing protein [Sphingobacteriales bacterium]